jgi:phosphoribosylformylglycinamidine synthase
MLTECGLLPGALIRNDGIRFRSQSVYLKVEETNSAFTNAYSPEDIIKLPIAHGDGNYYSIGDEIRQLEDEGRVFFRYCDRDGNLTKESNPNGSVNNIAGIVNSERNVLGMMPHPERAGEKILGSDDGLKVFESVGAALATLTTAGKA